LYANLIPIIRSLVLSKCVEWCKTDLFPHEQIDKSPALLTFSHWTFYSCWIEPCIQSFGYSIMTFFCYLLDLDFISLPWSWFWSSFAMLFFVSNFSMFIIFWCYRCSSIDHLTSLMLAPSMLNLGPLFHDSHHLYWILGHCFMILFLKDFHQALVVPSFVNLSMSVLRFFLFYLLPFARHNMHI
jgi:hypothetical protein